MQIYQNGDNYICQNCANKYDIDINTNKVFYGHCDYCKVGLELIIRSGREGVCDEYALIIVPCDKYTVNVDRDICYTIYLDNKVFKIRQYIHRWPECIDYLVLVEGNVEDIPIKVVKVDGDIERKFLHSSLFSKVDNVEAMK